MPTESGLLNFRSVAFDPGIYEKIDHSPTALQGLRPPGCQGQVLTSGSLLQRLQGRVRQASGTNLSFVMMNVETARTQLGRGRSFPNFI